MQYKLLSANTAYTPLIDQELERQVNEFLQSGWDPIGGVATYTYVDLTGQLNLVIYQAVIQR